MRIVHAIRSDAFAGVERHVAGLAVAQARDGHHVRVIGGDQAQMTRALEPAEVERVPATTVTQIARQLRSSSADVVHAHMTAAEAAATLSSRAPIVVTRHFARPRGSSRLGRLSGSLIRRRVRAQIAVSGYVAEHIDGPATIVYPGVDVDTRAAETRHPVVLVVQRLQSEKNTETAMRAFAVGAPWEWTLEIVGTGPEKTKLQALAVALGVAERVSFLGFRDDVPNLMRSSSVLMAPCEVEGLGLSVLEAMSHGLPVVASRAGAHPETVGLAEGARLYAPGDWREAGKLLGELAADPSAREVYGAGLRRVQRALFTLEAQSTATEAVYREVLS